MSRSRRVSGAAFALCAGGAGWVLAGYPLALLALPARPWRRDDAATPSLSILIPAFRERDALRRKLEALEGLDYPGERLQVIVLADEDPELPRIARAARPDALVLFEPERGGKAAGLNRGLAHATGDVVVMTDANNLLEPGSLRAAARHFADPSVWAVAGRRGEDGSAYDRYEDLLRRLETRSGSVAAMSGEFMAARRERVPPFAEGIVNDDFWLLSQIVCAGGRVVYDPDAASTEPPVSLRGEIGRRSRMGAGRVAALRDVRGLPPAFAWRALSHKHGRLALPFLLLGSSRRAPGCATGRRSGAPRCPVGLLRRRRDGRRGRGAGRPGGPGRACRGSVHGRQRGSRDRRPADAARRAGHPLAAGSLMCGIAGVVGGGQVDRELLRRMCDSLAHRGPDGEGIHVDGAVGLGMRRLAIIDLETGDQPIYSEDGRIVLVFNGEIYNYRELARELRVRGHRFAGESDSEVIVHLYEELGAECVHRLRGMFAFAIWDGRRGELLLARDRVGKKPLYWTIHDGALRFASEPRAILQDETVPRTVDYAAIDAFLVNQYVPQDMCAFAALRKLAPASRLRWRPGGEPAIERWWRLEYAPKQQLGLDEAAERLRAAILEATRLRPAERRAGRGVPLRRGRLERRRGRDGAGERRARADVLRVVPRHAARRGPVRAGRRGAVGHPPRGAGRRARHGGDAAADRLAFRRAVRRPRRAADLPAVGG
jgi:hypothetical protein